MSYNIHALPWDLATLLLIGSGFFLVWYAWKKRHIALMVFAHLLWITVFYGSFIEPQIITVTEEELTLPMEGEIRIIVLADLHVGPYKGRKFLDRVVAKVNALEPDLILLAGDYTYFGADPLDHLLPLQNLHPRYGTFAVLGNHEYGCHAVNPFYELFGSGKEYAIPVRRALERTGVIVLRNEWREVRLEGEGKSFVYVSGVDDTCSKQDDIKTSIPNYQTKSPLILISHSPDIILEEEAKRFNLIVSGHTHGGQIRLPFLGSIAPLPTQLGRLYDQGLYPIDNNTTLAITRGIGESSPRARLFAPPEILVLQAHGDEAVSP